LVKAILLKTSCVPAGDNSKSKTYLTAYDAKDFEAAESHWQDWTPS